MCGPAVPAKLIMYEEVPVEWCTGELAIAGFSQEDAARLAPRQVPQCGVYHTFASRTSERGGLLEKSLGIKKGLGIL